MAAATKSKTSKAKRTLRDAVTKAVTGIDPVTAEPATDEEREAQQVSKWTMEFQDADQFLKKWHTAGDRTIRRFLDDDTNSPDQVVPATRLNLFYSNIVTMKAILFAKLPKVEADRRFVDPNDDVARVAAEMITRIIQNDMNAEDDTTAEVLRNALQDRLLPGYGGARVKYCIEESGEGDAAIKADEWCETVYTHWKDVRWSPCRTAEEVRWKAFRAYMTKPEVAKRFGEEVAKEIPYASRGPELSPEKNVAGNAVDMPQDKQAEVWEIWDKTSKCVYWYVQGYQKFLDKLENPLELKEFFPDARPMMANTTTTRYIPKPDYSFGQDLYREIDQLETRISLLTAAAKCVGVYDRASGDVQRMFTEGVENQLIPVDNWAMFAERGGLKGVVEFFPLADVVSAIATLNEQQQLRIQQLYQVTGMSDILRGQASTAGVTATEQRIKAQFGSTRMQAIQEELANFAQDLLNKKVQIIRKFYDAQRIIKLSNIEAIAADMPFVEQAIQLIKSPDDSFDIRIAVQADSMAQVDYDSLKMERTEYLQAIAQYLGQSAGLIEQQPQSLPFLMKLMQFGLSAFKGGTEIEGVVDQFVAAAEQKIQQEAANPKPDPEMQKLQMEMQMKQQEMQQKAAMEQQKAQLEIDKARQELQIEREKSQLELQKLQLELQFMQQKFQMEAQQKQVEGAIKLQTTQQDAQIKQQSAVLDAHAEHESREMERESQIEERQFQQQARTEDRAFEKKARSEDRAFEVKARKEDQMLARKEQAAKPAAKK